jgi:hypothetical protein
MNMTAHVEEAKLQVYSDISDLYKSTYGVRPRHIDWRGLNLHELDAIYAELVPVAQAAFEAEEQAQKAATVEFEAMVAQ